MGRSGACGANSVEIGLLLGASAVGVSGGVDADGCLVGAAEDDGLAVEADDAVEAGVDGVGFALALPVGSGASLLVGAVVERNLVASGCDGGGEGDDSNDEGKNEKIENLGHFFIIFVFSESERTIKIFLLEKGLTHFLLFLRCCETTFDEKKTNNSFFERNLTKKQ